MKYSYVLAIVSILLLASCSSLHQKIDNEINPPPEFHGVAIDTTVVYNDNNWNWYGTKYFLRVSENTEYVRIRYEYFDPKTKEWEYNASRSKTRNINFRPKNKNKIWFEDGDVKVIPEYFEVNNRTPVKGKFDIVANGKEKEGEFLFKEHDQ